MIYTHMLADNKSFHGTLSKCEAYLEIQALKENTGLKLK